MGNIAEKGAGNEMGNMTGNVAANEAENMTENGTANETENMTENGAANETESMTENGAANGTESKTIDEPVKKAANQSAKEIIMLAETQGTADYVSRQLNGIFSAYASLSIVIADSKLPCHSLSASLVVIISKVLERQMQQYIKPGTRMLIADRMVDPCEAARLYDIPPGSDVLVVNTSPLVTEESIQQLMSCGMDRLKYHAYYPGITSYPQDCRYAVTFGEAHLIPKGSYEAVFDLHTRPIGISTCVRIADELGIYDQLRETLSSLYMNPLVRTAYELAVTGSQNKQISKNLQKVIDLFQDGVVVLDQAERIVFFNDIARRVLKIHSNSSQILSHILQENSLDDPFFWEIQSENYYFEPVISQLNREKSIILTIRNVERIEHIENSYRRSLLEKGLTARYSFSDIIYRSPRMGSTVSMAQRFSMGNSTVFIHGPSGCGKEMMAQAIHNASPRCSQPFVAINFASIPASLSESELFGYEEGAFTGAKRGGKLGLFQLAHRGTIFLDEIGDAPLELQKKLLRVVQERKVLPVGGTKLVPVDVRIIAASNQDMDELIASRQFREDLYYRLNVLPLFVPPLSQRIEDIIPLFLHFLQREFGIPPCQLNPEVRLALEQHPWNGNVRELHNAAEYVSNFAAWNPQWQSSIHLILHPKDFMQDTAMCKAAQDGQTQAKEQENNGQTNDCGNLHRGNAACSNWIAEQNQGKTAELLSSLEAHEDLRCFHRLLAVLNRSPYCWSRSAVAEYLAQTITPGENLPSNSQIKRDFLLLKSLGLVNAVTGKGTFLKEAGRELLRLLDRKSANKK